LTVGRHGDSDVTAASMLVVSEFVNVDVDVMTSLTLARAGTSLADSKTSLPLYYH